MSKRALIWYFAAHLFLVASCGDEKPEVTSASPHNFLRLSENEVTTAVKIYASKKNPKLKIRLLAVSHIGERPYYEHIQHLLDQSSTVLYEGLVVDFQNSPDLRCRQRDYIDPINGLASMLDLEMQKKVLNYNNAKFHNIDYPIATMKKWNSNFDCEASLKTFLSMIIKKRPDLNLDKLLDLDEENFKKIVNPRDLVTQKITRKQLFADCLLHLKKMPAELRKTAVTRRDEKALHGINKYLNDTGMMTVIYGAEHMPGLEAGLRKLGYTLESEEWLRVLTIK